MYADRGIPTLAVDLDPQANLTSMFLSEEELERLWPDDEHPDTVYGAIRPILRGIGDIATPAIQMLHPNLGLLRAILGYHASRINCQTPGHAVITKMNLRFVP